MDTQVILRCQAGDRQAFEELFNAYRDDVFRFAYLVVRDLSLAQDVTQESFLKVFRCIDKFQFRSSFKSWLYRVVVNEAITLMRRRRLKEDLDPEPEGSRSDDAPVRDWQPEEAVLDLEMKWALRDAIHQLDPVHRSVVILKYYNDFSDSEIAHVLKCPAGTVKSRLHRARELLRQGMVKRLGYQDFTGFAVAAQAAGPS